MKTFTVSWLIDVGADTPEEAARKALEIQRDPQSLAVHFSVEDRDTGKTYEIDLLDRTLGAADDERDSDPAPASGIGRSGTH